MRRARITFEGAFHHVMNRGIDGMAIFDPDMLKTEFIKLLYEKSRKYRIKILAYCVMNNHYHLILQNINGKMSSFQKDLNGQYALFYRKFKGSKGYIFQDRFKSILIQDNEYLLTSIRYVLQNPLRAKLVQAVRDYAWTSLFELETVVEKQITDKDFVLKLIGNKEVFISDLDVDVDKELPIKRSRCGDVLGTNNFIKTAYLKFDRRKESHPSKMGRIDDGWFDPVEKVIQEFEKEFDVDIEHMNYYSWPEKRIRGELLVRLKDLTGLTYRKIKEFPIFNDLKLNSMAKLYRDTVKRQVKLTK